ncbi:MAG: hypothetical protein HY303_07120 [Candidatus Wallbacteria bacterium]|nr:hypothetical protein [Candidatus Wallbacteria bacterium]
MAQRRGIAIPLVVLAIMIFMIFAGTLLFTSKGEYRLVKKTEDRERARYIAESAIAIASSLVFQNDFEDRWYRKTIGKYGYTHVIEGQFAGGSYRVRAEDIMNELTDDLKNDKEKRILDLKYKRIDLFARGVFGNEAVILYQALSLQPEEKVYGFMTTVLDLGDGVSQTLYSNIHVR